MLLKKQEKQFPFDMQITSLLTWVSATLKIKRGGWLLPTHIFFLKDQRRFYFAYIFSNTTTTFPKVSSNFMSSNVFLLQFFLQGKRIGKKKKTSVKSCNLNPYWNESFVFLIDEMDMKRVWLDVTVSIFFFKPNTRCIICGMVFYIWLSNVDKKYGHFLVQKPATYSITIRTKCLRFFEKCLFYDVFIWHSAES